MTEVALGRGLRQRAPHSTRPSGSSTAGRPARSGAGKATDRGGGGRGAVTLRLAYRPPYDWDAMLAFLAARAIPGVEVVERGRYAAPSPLGGRSWRAPSRRRRPRARGHDPLSPVRACRRSSRGSAASSTSAPIEAIGAHLAHDPFLAPLVAARPGLRAPGALGRLRAGRARRPRPAGHGRRRPRPRRQAGRGPRPAAAGRRAPVAGLTCLSEARNGSPPRSRPRSACRRPARRGSALAAAAPPTRSCSVPSATSSRRWRGCVRFPGIGEWTAQYIAMRALREPDAFPATDIGLLRGWPAADGAARPRRAVAPRRALAALARLCRAALWGDRRTVRRGLPLRRAA